MINGLGRAIARRRRLTTYLLLSVPVFVLLLLAWRDCQRQSNVFLWTPPADLQANVLAVTPVCGPWSAPVNGLMARIQAQAGTALEGDKLFAVVVLKNISSAPIKTGLANKFTGTWYQGTSPLPSDQDRRLATGWEDGMHSLGYAIIQPGEIVAARPACLELQPTAGAMPIKVQFLEELKIPPLPFTLLPAEWGPTVDGSKIRLYERQNISLSDVFEIKGLTTMPCDSVQGGANGIVLFVRLFSTTHTFLRIDSIKWDIQERDVVGIAEARYGDPVQLTEYETDCEQLDAIKVKETGTYHVRLELHCHGDHTPPVTLASNTCNVEAKKAP